MKNNGRKGRRGGGTALYVTTAGAFLVITVITAMGLFFKISTITVKGAGKYTEKEIIDASGIELDNSIFFVNMGSAEVRIKGALPYIDSVKISRSLPGTVVITVTESKGAVSFTSGGYRWVMSFDGRILERMEESEAGDTTEIRGITAEAPEVNKSLSLGPDEKVRLRSLLNLLAILDGRDRLELTDWVDVTNLAAVTFYCNGYKINVHQADDLEDLQRKFKLLDKFFADYPEAGHGQEVLYDDDNGYFRYHQ